MHKAIGNSVASAWEASLAAKKREDHLGVTIAATFAINRHGSTGADHVPLQISLAFRDIAQAHIEMHKAAVAKLPPPTAKPSGAGLGGINEEEDGSPIEGGVNEEKKREVERRRRKAAKGKGAGKGKGKSKGAKKGKDGVAGSDGGGGDNGSADGNGADEEQEGAWPR